MAISTTHLLIIVLAPLLGAIVAGFFGRLWDAIVMGLLVES